MNNAVLLQMIHDRIQNAGFFDAYPIINGHLHNDNFLKWFAG